MEGCAVSLKGQSCEACRVRVRSGQRHGWTDTGSARSKDTRGLESAPGPSRAPKALRHRERPRGRTDRTGSRLHVVWI